MFPINDYAVFERRQAELLKKAEIEQLLRQAESDRPETLRLSHRGAFWLGIHMVRWGKKLERFGTTETRQHAAPVLQRSLPL